jgi:hypothetical protein
MFHNVGRLLVLCRNICGVELGHRVCRVVVLSCREGQLELHQNHQICRHCTNNLEQATTLGSFVLLTVRLYKILSNDQFDAQFFSYVFISILYLFRANSCSSSGESIVSIQHLLT